MKELNKVWLVITLCLVMGGVLIGIKENAREEDTVMAISDEQYNALLDRVSDLTSKNAGLEGRVEALEEKSAEYDERFDVADIDEVAQALLDEFDSWARYQQPKSSLYDSNSTPSYGTSYKFGRIGLIIDIEDYEGLDEQNYESFLAISGQALVRDLLEDSGIGNKWSQVSLRININDSGVRANSYVATISNDSYDYGWNAVR